jgi:hypothetical protein
MASANRWIRVRINVALALQVVVRRAIQFCTRFECNGLQSFYDDANSSNLRFLKWEFYHVSYLTFLILYST